MGGGGVYNIKEVDKLHLRFCKTLLSVKRSTPNLAVYGELGRFPFSLLDKQRALKFWIKVMKNHLSLQYKLYNEQCKINNATSLAKRVHSIIDHTGLHTMSCINTMLSTNFSEHTKKATNMNMVQWEVNFTDSVISTKYDPCIRAHSGNVSVRHPSRTGVFSRSDNQYCQTHSNID